MPPIHLTAPLSDEKILRTLKCGDEVLLSGKIITGRDAFHKKIASMKEPPEFLQEGTAIYHCGPITKKNNNKLILTAAGPTTSWRMSLYAPILIEKFKIKIFIGKGGMNDEFSNACKKFCAVYLSFPGGCAQSAINYLCEIRNVYFLDEFGPAEAAYEIIAKNFPLLVTIDANGKNLHKEILKKSLLRFSQITH